MNQHATAVPVGQRVPHRVGQVFGCRVGRQAEADLHRSVFASRDRARWAFSDDPTVRDHRHAIGEVFGLVHVVRRQEHRDAQGSKPRDHVPGRSPGRRVEAGGGLVEKQQFGVPDERQRDVQTPTLAAREPAGSGIGSVRQAHQRERLLDVSGRRVIARIQLQALRRGQIPLRLSLLEYNTDSGPPRRPGVLRIFTEDSHFAAATAPVTLEDLNRGGLPGTVRPQEREDLATNDPQVDPAHSLERAVAHAQTNHIDHGPAAATGLWARPIRARRHRLPRPSTESRGTSPRRLQRHDSPKAAHPTSSDPRDAHVPMVRALPQLSADADAVRTVSTSPGDGLAAVDSLHHRRG